MTTPTPSLSDDIEQTYTSLIQQYLGLHCTDNAIFLAERFYAQFPSSNNALYLLATCYHRNGETKRAHAILKSHASSVGPLLECCRYLWARCCLDLELYAEGEEVLLLEVDLKSLEQSDLLEKSGIPWGAAGFNLLGKLCRKANRRKRAIDYFTYSLQLDPMMWTSFSALCEMGADIDTVSIFGVSPKSLTERPLHEMTESAFVVSSSTVFNKFKHSNSNLRKPSSPPSSAVESSVPRTRWNPSPIICATPTFDESKENTQRYTCGSFFNNNSNVTSFASLTDDNRDNRGPPVALFQTPNLTPIQSNDQTIHSADIKQNLTIPSSAVDDSRSVFKPSFRIDPLNESRTPVARARKIAARLYYDSSPETQPAFPPGTVMKKRQSPLLRTNDETKVEINEQFNENTSNDFHNKKSHVHFEKSEQEHVETLSCHEVNESAIKEILNLLCSLGSPYKLLCQYDCQNALNLFHQLPVCHYRTGWVQHQVGKAFFEMADYLNAKNSLKLMHTLEPHRMKGLEILSTTHWHLKEEVELCYLAQSAVDFDRLAPESWCVVGNCFSLQKEHETALRFFKRSIQLDPCFTYSHTLSGHEYDSNEDFEKAIACFRKAIHSDDRHYNAWYGLGAIYYRLEKYDLAEYHFKRALAINTQSSVLLCNLGMLQHVNKKPFEALATLERAFQLDPRNPQARFQRAKIFMSMERYDDALKDLLSVRNHVPRESSVQFMLGNVYKKLGQIQEAMRCYMTALDLEPKDNNMIKSAIDKLEEDDADEEVSAF